MRYSLLTFSLLFLAIFAKAQEFNCTVRINTPKLQTVDPKVFKTLENAITEFMNNTKWTEDTYDGFEKIECNIQINIKEEKTPTTFSGELFIQANRPVYGSSYKTVLIEHADKSFDFSYTEYQPIEFIENAFSSNMMSILGFYAYYMLGMDYDSFSPMGGAIYFQKANNILNNVPQGAAGGWSSLEPGGRNRYWMIESILSPRVAPLREATYMYHRQGMDNMHENPELGLANVMKAMQKLKEVNTGYPNAMATQMFVNAKAEEIIQILLGGTSTQRRDVYGLMVKIDPSNASRYTPIRR